MFLFSSGTTTKTVIADRHFADKIKTDISAPAAGDTIFLTSYKPNELKYKSHTSKNNFAVFSEIYFPWGWHISIDGEPVEMARVNYVLRGLDIPSGDHEIIFRFDPQSIHISGFFFISNFLYFSFYLFQILIFFYSTSLAAP